MRRGTKVPPKPQRQRPKKLESTSKLRDSSLEAVKTEKSLLCKKDENLQICNDDLQTVQKTEIYSEVCKSENYSDFNSYKFSRPRIYVKNDYKSARNSHLAHLQYIAANVGPKERTPAYSQFIDRLLLNSVHKTQKKKKGSYILINNIDFSAPTLKVVKFTPSKMQINALVDTGSTHCLISVKFFQRLKEPKFTPLKVNMKVAGSVLRDNIVGSTTICTSFQTDKGIINIPLDFLIAHALNGYEAILGATMLLDPEMTSAITPTHLCLTSNYKEANVVMQNACKRPQANLMLCKNYQSIRIPSGVAVRVNARLNSAIFSPSGDELETLTLVNGLAILNCTLLSEDTVQCTVKNISKQQLELDQTSFMGVAYGYETDLNSADLNFSNSSLKGQISEKQFLRSEKDSASQKDDESELSIDEQIIAEHQLLDPSDLDKRFSHKDCEINPNLKPDIRKALDKIISDNKSVFATSKLDVGRFPGFTVSLEIDEEISSEKQRFMAEEKLAYCKKTFEEFEKLGLVQECHSPKTVSNLLLVPKYEGLRDLTKASVYLAQVKGEKNSSFRIVQDLRRINAKTKNIKKASPKLPEFIFQKLKNKIVSSVDCNMAYWHLVLDPDSRSYTSFYLQNRTLQFCRMPQGLATAPACWDHAMSIIFSKETLEKIRKQLSSAEAKILPSSFEDFFTYYQDDSWIFSNDEESHLIHLKAVLT